MLHCRKELLLEGQHERRVRTQHIDRRVLPASCARLCLPAELHVLFGHLCHYLPWNDGRRSLPHNRFEACAKRELLTVPPEMGYVCIIL